MKLDGAPFCRQKGSHGRAWLDRLEAFGSLPPGQTKKIVYTVRAVTSGKFTIPPVEAEAMYDPTLWARDKGGTAVVSGPWTGKLL